jgi:hypothetical protein
LSDEAINSVTRERGLTSLLPQGLHPGSHNNGVLEASI